MAQLTTDLVTRAQAGDGQAFGQLVDPYRRELQVHCYRLLGSVQDAEDALQETLLAAWRGLGRFEGRASVRTWLYRVATNRCLNARRARSRRPRTDGGALAPGSALAPGGPGADDIVTGGPRTDRSGSATAGTAAPGVAVPDPTRLGEVAWLEPYPDVLLEGLADSAPGPEATWEAREAISLAFITALQLLPPRQRAVLILRDVLSFRASEVAQILDTTQDSVTSALKRARATLRQRLPGDREPSPPPGSAGEQDLLDQLTRAFETVDVPGIVALLTDDVWLTMPPMPLEYQGRDLAGRFFMAVMRGRPYRTIATRANGQPAVGMYVQDPQARICHAVGLLVFTLAGSRVCAVTRFDPGVLPRFGLPRTLPD